MEKSKFNFQGVNGNLEVYSDRVEMRISGGFFGGDKTETIFIKDMTSVEVKEANIVSSGYIQFSAPGTNESNNKITLGGWSPAAMSEKAKEVKSFILQQMQILKSESATPATISTSDELLKLSQLKDSGVLTDDEFQLAKKKLLNI